MRTVREPPGAFENAGWSRSAGRLRGSSRWAAASVHPFPGKDRPAKGIALGQVAAKRGTIRVNFPDFSSIWTLPTIAGRADDTTNQAEPYSSDPQFGPDRTHRYDPGHRCNFDIRPEVHGARVGGRDCGQGHRVPQATVESGSGQIDRRRPNRSARVTIPWQISRQPPQNPT